MISDIKARPWNLTVARSDFMGIFHIRRLKRRSLELEDDLREVVRALESGGSSDWEKRSHHTQNLCDRLEEFYRDMERTAAEFRRKFPERVKASGGTPAPPGQENWVEPGPLDRRSPAARDSR